MVYIQMRYGSDHLVSGCRAWKLRVVRESVGVGKKGTQISKLNFCLPSVIIGNLLQRLSENLR